MTTVEENITKTVGSRGNRLAPALIRLRTATAGEVMYRAREKSMLALLGFRAVRSILSRRFDADTAEVRLPEFRGKVSPETVRRILQGYRPLLESDSEAIRRFESGCRKRFSGRIPAVDHIDIRSVWEPARLQYLTLLLQALRTGTADPDRAVIEDYVRRELLDWIRANPFMRGPHYMTAMECGLRIPVFILALQTLGGLKAEEKRAVFRTIYAHAWIVGKRLSLYASLGNHTVAECVGLVFAGGLFRQDRRGRRWLAAGIDLLEQECVHQIRPDGGPAEQSTAYHRFVLDLFRMAAVFLEINGFRACAAMKDRLAMGEQFLAAMEFAPGRVPDIGDNDQAAALAPGLDCGRGEATEAWPPASSGIFRNTTFDDTGLTIVRGRDGLFLVFDHGPLGMSPLFNHGHADALSVFLSLDGIPFLIDTGTYRYNTAPDWRRYLRGTAAHNTVCVDRHDQAEQISGFAWRDGYSVRRGPWNTADRIVLTAEHDGYARLKTPVRHRRTLIIEAGNVAIEDIFFGEGRHLFELNFHLHPRMDLEPDVNGLALALDGRRMTIRCDQGRFVPYRGQTAPLLGWVASAYGRLEETTTIQVRQQGRADEVVFQTFIAYAHSRPAEARE